MAKPSWAGVIKLQPFDADEDSFAAPARGTGEQPAPAWTWRRAQQNIFWVYALGLVFIVFAVVGAITDTSSTSELTISLIGCAVICVGYIGTAYVADGPFSLRVAYVIGFCSVLSALSIIATVDFMNYAIYGSVMIAALLPWRYARLAVIGWNVIGFALGFWLPDGTILSISLTGLAVGLTMGAGMESGRIARKLDRSRQRVSMLAVAAERERIGRDLHDILGHSLTAISIKASLAGKLIEVDPDAAKKQIAEVEEVARQALADVRSTASAIREVRVAGEIASARSVLLAAGIEAVVPAAVEPMSGQRSELFGYVVREAVTNVVRHSEATVVTIALAADQVSITDNGRGLPAGGGQCSGSGLRGLQERVSQAGGRLIVEAAQPSGTTVRAEFSSGDAAEVDPPLDRSAQLPSSRTEVPA